MDTNRQRRDALQIIRVISVIRGRLFLSAEILWRLFVVNRRHKRHVQHTCAIVISEHNNQSAGRIQERVITRWHVNHRAISGAQSERLPESIV